jgi:hypothetical protein
MMLSTLFLAGTLAASATVPRTMRLDYYHTGNASQELFSLDRLVLEGQWPGPPDRMIDDTNLGKYQFQIINRRTNRLLYSRGFASIYGEWETTPEATEISRTFHESLRFPEPAGPFQVVLKKRDRQNAFREIWSIVLDPESPEVDRAVSPTAPKAQALMKNGDPADKVDLLLMGDGYTAGEMGKWHRDARRLMELLFAVSPFKERRSDFNVWMVDTPADETGISRPSDGLYRRSPLRTTYDAFGSERYILTFDNRRLREAAAAAPYEFIEIVVNDRKYGGGGIFNLYATVAADSAWAPYIFVHEFGHHFAGLADEYYTSEVAYESRQDRPEPWEPNVTADPQAARWKDLLTPGIPLPTPWPKEEFEALQKQAQEERHEIRARKGSEDEMDALFLREQKQSTKLLDSGPFAGKVGAFEGAMYQAEGYFRPQADCIMFTRDEVGFCAVCRRAIEHVIELYAGGEGKGWMPRENR